MSDRKIRLAIVGVGNCASALAQGLEFYRDAPPEERVPGLMHVAFGPYHVSDVEIVAAFDVDGKKVGKDVAEAIVTEPNNTIQFADVAPTGVTVRRGPTLDGLGRYYREQIVESSRSTSPPCSERPRRTWSSTTSRWGASRPRCTTHMQRSTPAPGS